MNQNLIITTPEQLESIINKCIQKLVYKEVETETKELLTAEELCKKLNKSRQTIYNWTKQGKIQSLKVGRSVFYDLPEVMKFIRSQEHDAHV